MNVLRRIWYSLRHRNIDADLAEELARVLAVAGAAATFVPARNAARIEPVNALRHE
jgi:hypothetical protein